MPKTPDSLTYAGSGVDIEAGDRLVGMIETMVRRTHGPRVIGQHGGFSGLFRLDYNERLFKRNFKDPVLVACTDGVGTKVKLAIELGRFDTIGIDCVAMNVNDLLVSGAEPLFFLDYIGLHKQVPEITARIVKGVAEGCRIADCALLGGECAEMPDIYAEGDFDLAGFAVGVVELHRAVDPMRVERDDVVIGLASSGVHSNGFSLVRQLLRRKRVPLDRRVASLHRDDDDDRGVGEVLLEPTRIYTRPVVRLLRRYKVKRIVSGMAHVTGGGLPGNVNRALHGAVDAELDRSTWTVPPIFEYLQHLGDVDPGEMDRVFNMGVGFVLIVRPTFADSVVRQLRRLGEDAFVMGRIVKGKGRVRMVGEERD